MPLKLNLIIPNKAVHAFIGMLILFVLVAGAFAYNDMVLKLAPPATVPNPGHSSTEVMVNLGPDTGDPCTGDSTLQDALDNDCFNISNPFVPTCSEGEILETDASGVWQCVAYTDPPFIPSCADDEILEASGGSWQCTPKEGIKQIVCAIDEYLQFDGSDWVCAADGACIPSGACAAITCVGEQCSDSCGNLYAGTKTDGICCIDTSWIPSPSTVCSGVSFTQTSNCGRTRSASGTMTGGTCCIDTSWIPSPSTVCSGTNFTQTSNCGRTRSATGTQVCCVPNCSCATTLCPGSTCSDGCGGTCNGIRNCSSCQPTVCVPYNVGICQGSISGGNCCVSGYPVCVSMTVGICQGRLAGSYCCVQNCPVCNIFNVGICQGRLAGGYCCTF